MKRHLGFLICLLAVLSCIPIGRVAAASPAAPNLLPTGDFNQVVLGGYDGQAESGIWAASDLQHTHIAANDARHTDGPHIRMAATAQTSYLFSPFVDVNAGAQYEIAADVTVRRIESGEVGFYIHEYNAAGQEISGQWKLGLTEPDYTAMLLTYTPSSPAVRSASLELYAQAGSGSVVVLDTVTWCLAAAVPPVQPPALGTGNRPQPLAPGWLAQAAAPKPPAVKPHTSSAATITPALAAKPTARPIKQHRLVTVPSLKAVDFTLSGLGIGLGFAITALGLAVPRIRRVQRFSGY